MIKIKNNKLDVIIYFFAKFFSGIFGFVQISILTYFLEPKLYGDYSLVLGLINILVAIFIGWISSSCLRYYSDYKKTKNTFYSNLFADWFVMVIITVIVLLLVSVMSTNIPVKNYLSCVILLIIFNSTYELLNSLLRASKETILYFLLVVGNYILNIVFFIFFYKMYEMRVNGILLASSISYIITTVIVIIKLRIYKYIELKNISKEVQIRFAKYGLPMIGVWATSWILNYSDRYLIKIFTSQIEVAYYDIAYKLAENSINIIITSLSMAMMPQLIEKYNNEGIHSAENYHSKFLKLFFLIVIPCIFGIIGIRNVLYSTIVSKEYILGADIIIYISISMLFYGINQFIYKLIQLKEKTNIIFKIMLLSVFINIVLNIIFIPKYGYMTSAITTLIANIISTIIAFFYCRKSFKINFNFKILLKISIAAFIMYVFVTLVIKPTIFNLIFTIIIAIAIYIIEIIVFRCIDMKEIKDILTTKNQEQ